MDEAAFAAGANHWFREIYAHGARRVADARERLSPETAALLLHLAQAGPLSPTELAQHLARAPSTLSAKLAALEAQGLLARQADEHDGRRARVWLSPAGRAALDDSLQVLDTDRLAAAAARLSAAERGTVVQALATLHRALHGPLPEAGDPPAPAPRERT